MTEKNAWFISLWDDNNSKTIGLGECSIIDGLTPEYVNHKQYEELLEKTISAFCLKFSLDEVKNNFKILNAFFQILTQFPSILFGLETAILDLINGGKAHFFDTDFTLKQKNIPINGLIWMGDKAFIQQQIKEKIELGFTCLKMKVGALNFSEELEILNSIRKNYSEKDLILRVDANGAFSDKDVEVKLNSLSKLNIHSIEQPIKPGNWNLMADLCHKTPIPIALDEELIGINEIKTKIELLNKIKPQYIILKPSLHGGMIGCNEWIQLANEVKIPWWITSALESNVGLNAIAQFASTFKNPLHQGLGTGSLYVENTATKLKVENGFIFLEI